jgi:hypothetical protein
MSAMSERLGMTEQELRAVVAGMREGEVPGGGSRSSASLQEANQRERVEQLAAWADLLVDQGKGESEIADILRASEPDADASGEIEAALKKVKRRRKRGRGAKRTRPEEEAVVGRSDAGTRGDVDLPDSPVGEAERRARRAEKELGIDHFILAEEYDDPCG